MPAVIRVRDTAGPLQHVYVAAEVAGCELETLIGALHGNLAFRAVRDAPNAPVRFDVIGATESLAAAVGHFKALFEPPPVPDAEAPPPAP